MLFLPCTCAAPALKRMGAADCFGVWRVVRHFLRFSVLQGLICRRCVFIFCGLDLINERRGAFADKAGGFRFGIQIQPFQCGHNALLELARAIMRASPIAEYGIRFSHGLNVSKP